MTGSGITVLFFYDRLTSKQINIQATGLVKQLPVHSAVLYTKKPHAMSWIFPVSTH